MRRPLILLALAALVPLALLAAGLGFATLRQQQETMREDALSGARGIMADVERELDSYLEVLSILSQSPLFDGDAPDLERFRILATRIGAAWPIIDRIILSDRNERQVFNSFVEPGTPLPPVVDLEGHRRIMETGRAEIGDLTGPGPFSADGLPRATLRVPVVREGETRYVLVAIVSLDRLNEILTGRDLPEGWRPFLIDGTGRLAAAAAAPELVGTPAGENALAARASGLSGIYPGRTPAGDPVVTAFVQHPRTGWSSHVSIPLTLYREPLVRSAGLVALGGLAALVLTGTFAHLFRRELQASREEALSRERAARLESLGRVAGGVAHDVNNVLHVVLAGIALVRRHHPDERVERFLQPMKEAAEKGTQTTRGLLAFSRGGSGSKVATDLVAHVRGLEPMLRQALRGDIALAVDLPAEPLVAEVDTTQLDLALLNLLSNARDAMPGGGAVRVSLDTRTESGLGRVARLCVSDTGPGIPEEVLARAFEPFYTTKPVGSGTGLGLAQVYGFARSAGGAARIASPRGGGASIEMLLPLTEATRAASGDAAADEAPSPAVKRCESSDPCGRVLVVDDNEAVRTSTAAFLADLGFDVVQAANAAEALAVFAQNRSAPEMVVTDLVMPGAMSGLDLAEAIKARARGTTIVLVTGYSDAASEAARRGFPILAKPVDFDRLASLLGAEGRSAA
ncbi:hybrid sensor histidine kinase/response regulator [Salinarimonas ramus]|uniref:hybrid sensor histidine kinase/response regulator n=1 Tax=Salinarimonas ramus TaxID=690164 RepID=UPI00166490AC|nr:ATP-binding protein [Salinarimonas ramus]